MTKQNYSKFKKDTDYFLPSEKWKKLTPEARKIWGSLPNNTKSIILKQDKNPTASKSSNYSSSKNNSSSKITKTMLHELLNTLDDDQESNNSS